MWKVRLFNLTEGIRTLFKVRLIYFNAGYEWWMNEYDNFVWKILISSKESIVTKKAIVYLIKDI